MWGFNEGDRAGSNLFTPFFKISKWILNSLHSWNFFRNSIKFFHNSIESLFYECSSFLIQWMTPHYFAPKEWLLKDLLYVIQSTTVHHNLSTFYVFAYVGQKQLLLLILDMLGVCFACFLSSKKIQNTYHSFPLWIKVIDSIRFSSFAPYFRNTFSIYSSHFSLEILCGVDPVWSTLLEWIAFSMKMFNASNSLLLRVNKKTKQESFRSDRLAWSAAHSFTSRAFFLLFFISSSDRCDVAVVSFTRPDGP